MYDKKETDISYKYLKSIISKLKEPIVIIGGWATYLTVNKLYKKQFGINYLGSRDIDLGFNAITSLKETIKILEKDNFKLVSFRYLKEINYETGEELTSKQSKDLPLYSIFPMYIDLLVSKIDSKGIKEIGFTPADEPLIKLIFENKDNRTELNEFGKKLWLPSPEIILATKINSVANRTKDHKKIKDYCDIISICLYSGKDLNDLITSSKKYFVKRNILKLKNKLDKKELQQVSNILKIDLDIIERIINSIVE
ncbi:MAG: nucleotidyl transferase AbiEii/AbiGii toxin family protein [archaeon]